MTVLFLGLPGWAGAWWVLGLDLTAFKRCVALGFGVIGPCAWGASVHPGELCHPAPLLRLDQVAAGFSFVVVPCGIFDVDLELSGLAPPAWVYTGALHVAGSLGVDTPPSLL